MKLFRKWLTDEERANLSGKERRALRRQRRSEYKAEHGKTPFGEWLEEASEYIHVDVVRDIAVTAITDGLAEGTDRSEIVHDALEDLVDAVDDVFDFSRVPMVGGLLEMYDGLLAEKYLRPLVDRLYDEIVAAS